MSSNKEAEANNDVKEALKAVQRAHEHRACKVIAVTEQGYGGRLSS